MDLSLILMVAAGYVGLKIIVWVTRGVAKASFILITAGAVYMSHEHDISLIDVLELLEPFNLVNNALYWAYWVAPYGM